MRMSDKFRLEEEDRMLSSLGQLVPYCSWSIVRVSDDKVIRTFNDYLDALKYLEELENRSWLVS